MQSRNRLHRDNEHRRAFMATSMNNNARYDRSTNFLELEVNVPRTIGILRDECISRFTGNPKNCACKRIDFANYIY